VSRQACRLSRGGRLGVVLGGEERLEEGGHSEMSVLFKSPKQCRFHKYMNL
jgi:hypothetical protein